MNKKPLKEAHINKQELKKIRQQINNNSKPTNKNNVKIIAVTKTYSYKAIEEAYENGIFDIGESKIQEIEQKIKNKKIPKKVKIHLLGHLQTNKAKKAVELCDYIQSIDTLKIAKAVNKEAHKKQKKQKIYLQINIGKDPQKYGFTKNKAIEASNQINQMHNLQFCGIMTILPQTSDTKQIKQLYNKMKKISLLMIKTNPRSKEISMGMSNDYHIALTCGATNIRIGTRLFGKRK